jgi:predicted SnoaL-like aldol condensation-catalyzing enzyme
MIAPLQKEPAMIEIMDVNDSRAVRNKNNVLALYDLMINKKKSEEATAKFVSPAYIQHNQLIADGPVALGKFFGQVHGSVPRPASSSTGLSPSAIIYGRM